MAKGKKKRGNDAKLRVISGGAAPKAVVTKRPQVAAPVSTPKAPPPNLRRDVAAKAVREPSEDTVDASSDDVSVARPLPKQSAIPRAAMFAALVIAVGFAAWALTRNSMSTPSPAPVVSSTPQVEWNPSSPPILAPLPVMTASAVPSVTASAVPSASVEPTVSVSASAPASVPVPAPVPAASSAPPPPAPTVIAPKPAAPPPPPPPAPKPAEDNPYQ